MRWLTLILLVACKTKAPVTPPGPPKIDCTPTLAAAHPTATCATAPASNIEHVVVIVQENHTFDTYFGEYCQAAVGSNPTCNTGPACCEAAPAKDPGSGEPPTVLDDRANAVFNPNHTQDCEIAEIDGGTMTGFISTTNPAGCGYSQNFAYATPSGPQAPYIAMAQAGAVADRYFQPAAGQSSSNDMYLAEARFVFKDNDDTTASLGSVCTPESKGTTLSEANIGDLLNQCSVPWGFYIEGYGAMVSGLAQTPPTCPTHTAECLAATNVWPCVYDPTDIPFQYYASTRDQPNMKDFSALASDVAAGTLPAVSFVKRIGYKTEHPGYKNTISDGVAAVQEVITTLQSSATIAASTLILVTWDEGGGYFDHVAPPPYSKVDCQPYGTRIPLIAVGPFAKTNYVSHTQMEHSSLVKFIEWNWLNGQTGQLGNRDATVNNIGDMLDPASTGVAVPAN